MENFILNPIGKILTSKDQTMIKLNKKYINALTGLEGFSHLQILWWFDGCDNELSRSKLVEKKPYKDSPDILGTFATRSPERPNPIALSCVHLIAIDYDNAIITLDYIDGNNGSPVLDIKPYTPSLDKVETSEVPNWCNHWPNSIEKSASFNWEDEFNF